MKLSLGQAARTAGMSKSTLQRMLQRGHIAGTQRPDSVWEIDMSEVQRLIDSRDAPQRGKRVPAPVEATVPPVEAVVELAELRVRLEEVRGKLADAIERAKAAETQAAEALARERAAADRVAALIEDKRNKDAEREAADREAAARAERLLQAVEDLRKPRGFWARLTGG